MALHAILYNDQLNPLRVKQYLLTEANFAFQRQVGILLLVRSVLAPFLTMVVSDCIFLVSVVGQCENIFFPKTVNHEQLVFKLIIFTVTKNFFLFHSNLYKFTYIHLSFQHIIYKFLFHSNNTFYLFSLNKKRRDQQKNIYMAQK